MKRLFLILSLCVVVLVGCSSKFDSWQEKYDLGVRYLSEGNYEEAIIAFTAAIEIDQKNVAAYLGRAESYIGSGETAENLSLALKDYEKVAELDETSSAAYLGMADVYTRQGEDEKAIEVLNNMPEITNSEAVVSKPGITGNEDVVSDSESLENKVVNTESEYFEKESTYRIVVPTPAEIAEIPDRLFMILGNFDYNCETDNISSKILTDVISPTLTYMPNYDYEIEKYISQVLPDEVEYEYWSEHWSKEFLGPDPLGYFDMPEGNVFNHNYTQVDYETLYKEYYERESFNGTYGYNKHISKVIDWVIEGVWNGNVDHINYENKKLYYYYDGYYYTAKRIYDAGLLTADALVVNSITPLENGKFELVYTTMYEDMELNKGKAVIAMKEGNGGFRFWSIYSTETT